MSSNLTKTQKRVIAIMLIGGRLNQEEFNTLCNADGLNKTARRRAVKEINERPKLVEALLFDNNA